MQIDTAYLADLFGDDVEEAGRVLAMMFDSSRQQLQQLRKALAGDDRGAIGDAAHQMAGATVICGLVDLSRRLRALEVRAKTESLETLSATVDAIALTLDEAQAEGRRQFPLPSGATPDA